MRVRCFIFAFLLLLFPLIAFSDQPKIIASIHAGAKQTLFGYHIVPMGDHNNDGYDDFITWDYRMRAFICQGGLSPEINVSLQIDSVGALIDNLGDVNEDGYCDFAITGRSNYGWKLGLYLGGTDMDTLRDAWFGWDSLFGIGCSMYGIDINNNGINEIASRSNTQKSVLIWDVGLMPDSIPDIVLRSNIAEYHFFGEGLTGGDFNGDGAIDLAVNLRRDPMYHVNGEVWFYWGGQDADTLVDLIIVRRDEWDWGKEEFGRVLENLGDVNGDGFDDIYAGTGNSSDTMGFVYFCGPLIDTIPDVIIYEKSEKARAAGDINDDGYSDLILGYGSPWSGSGNARIFYGGPAMDNIADIEIYNSDIPGIQYYFGQDVSGVGDFNNDGVDDFAVSAGVDCSVDEYYDQGVVYVFSGISGSTDVEIEHIHAVPDDFHLYQNYPNPFNPHTIIEFDLPRRSEVSLNIVNILGRNITCLVADNLSAGTYRVQWNGTDTDNNPVASGVYFYQLQADNTVTTRKMTLLR